MLALSLAVCSQCACYLSLQQHRFQGFSLESGRGTQDSGPFPAPPSFKGKALETRLILQWSYQISAACHALRYFYILFLTAVSGKCKLASEYKGGRVGVQLTSGVRPRNFFLFFFPFRRVLSLFFFHQDAYKCFPFIIFLNINAPIIIIGKPTLFLCSFHNNNNKCFVGYF